MKTQDERIDADEFIKQSWLSRVECVLLNNCAELTGTFVGSMLGSDFGELFLGALIGLAAGAAVHWRLNVGEMPEPPLFDVERDR